ncbi:CynX/NimT family MFS transporter [Pseudomonas chlororaphis]|uniref:MFS transporter n=1 Tax=Pseudomonas chlororaphis TaxID=587753 RepID=A0A1Q8EPN1_9PSED|nr:MFS transporter [Pseudomonas chlororaphis]OLF53729.1 MFS transporter [Pseudomonas chlororaphis]
MTSTKPALQAYAPAASGYWPAVLNVLFAGIAAALHIGKATIALPELQHEFGRSLESLSWIISAFPFVGVFGGIAAGILVQRWGDRYLLVLGLLIMAAASALGSCLHDFHALVATRFVEGLGFVIVVVAAPAVLNRLVPAPRRNLAFGIWSTFMAFGIGTSLLFGPLLGGWQQGWIAGAVLTLLAALLLPLTTPRDPLPLRRQAQPALRDSLGSVLRARQPLVMALIFSAYNLQFFAVMAFLPVFLMQRVGLSIATAGLVSAAIVAVNIVGNLSAGLLLSRGVRPQTLLAGTSIVMGLSGMGIFLSMTPTELVIPLCFFFCAVAGMLPATILASTPRTAPEPTLIPLCLGLVMQGNYLGQVVAPIALSAAVGYAGWSAPAALVLGAAVLGVVLALRLKIRA